MAKTGFAVAAPIPIGEVVEIAKAAEAQGYESFWLTEGPGGRDATVRLAYVAASTRRIKLGTAILTIFSRTPVAMAQAAGSLQELSGGRFILGLGTGHKANMENTQGQAFLKPITRMRDYVHILRALWKDGRASYKGGVVSAAEARLFTKPSHPLRVYIACLGGPLAGLSGEAADGVLPLMASPKGIEQLREGIARGAAKAGRDPKAVDICCLIVACASSDRASAEAEARRQIGRYGSLPFYQKMMTLGGFADEVKRFQEAQAAGQPGRIPELVSDRMLESLALLGDASQWRKTLERFRAAGVTHPIVYAAGVGADAKRSLLQAVRTLGNLTP